jgi:enoyl-CoA hydratase/carnithine racemase
MKTYETILTEPISDHLLKVTLNRPEVGNAKNTQMGLDLLDLWTGLIDNPGKTRCVILTGAGDRAMAAPARNLRTWPRRPSRMPHPGHRRRERPRLRRRPGNHPGL